MMPLKKIIPQKCQNCGRYFVVGECGVAEDIEERLQRRGLPTMMLGDILGDSTKCVCGVPAFMDVESSESSCFVCGCRLSIRWKWREARWNDAGNRVAHMCQTCLKKENKRVQADKKLGRNGERQFPEWDDNGNIAIKVR